jgi:thiol:disulfide interchange protein DsbC
MKYLLTAVLLATFSFSSLAQASNTDFEQNVKAKLAQIGLKAKEISDSPIPGIKQVMSNRGVFYVSADGKHFIAGRIFDLDNGMQNLTEQALSSLRLDGLKQYSDSMIVFPAKNEKHKVTVFTDTTCGYCQKLHREMSQYNDLGITVQYLAFPRGGLYSQSFEDIKSVWCAADPKAAMTTAKAGKHVDSEQCNAPIAGHYDLGQAAGVTGTPAIVLEDGRMIPGYKPAQALLQVLETQ